MVWYKRRARTLPVSKNVAFQNWTIKRRTSFCAYNFFFFFSCCVRSHFLSVYTRRLQGKITNSIRTLYRSFKTTQIRLIHFTTLYEHCVHGISYVQCDRGTLFIFSRLSLVYSHAKIESESLFLSIHVFGCFRAENPSYDQRIIALNTNTRSSTQ